MGVMGCLCSNSEDDVDALVLLLFPLMIIAAQDVMLLKMFPFMFLAILRFQCYQ